MSQGPLEALDRARTQRVDLGAFTAEELWRAGVPVPGVTRRPDPPAHDRVPGGMGIYRRLAKAPAPSLAAQVAEADGESLHVSRLAEMLEPEVVKVVEQRRGQDRYALCVQPVRTLVDQILTDAGRTGLEVARAARFVCAFSNRFHWVETRGRLRRSSSWTLENETVSPDERVYLDVRLAPGPPTSLAHELSPEASRCAPDFAVTPGMDGIAASLTGFAGTLWDQFAPGPKPLSG